MVVLLLACFQGWTSLDTDGDGFTAAGGDCNDQDAGVSPDAQEIWYDGIDQDCDGNDADQDGDGFVAADYAYDWRAFPLHTGEGDCWDDPAAPDTEPLNDLPALTADAVHPGADEVIYDGIDGDCSGDSDFDADGDGVDTAHWPQRDGSLGDDCVDQVQDATFTQACNLFQIDPTLDELGIRPEDIHPGAEEHWYDGLDQDCAGDSDFDGDGDGFLVCQECDDTDATAVPTEDPDAWYDCVDANCDGNDGDADGDGFAAATLPDGSSYTASCADWASFPAHRQIVFETDGTPSTVLPLDCWDQPVGPGTLNGFEPLDGDDIHPQFGADDVYYDGVDLDCDGRSEFDADDDGHDAAGYVQRDGSEGQDCDDDDPDVFPDQVEVCDDVDSDCDGTLNDADADGCLPYYQDVDGDGAGTQVDSACLCEPQDLLTATVDGDCDDGDDTVYPTAPELCDGQDNDCDSALDATELDTDADGYVSCTIDADGWDGGAVPLFDDCDDGDDTVHPTATELCDGQDNDCDSSLDPLEIDDDADGFVECVLDAGGWDGASTVSHEDCDDGDANTYPGATEVVADGVDQDCDTQETCYTDADLDGEGGTGTQASADLICTDSGESETGTDCDDTDATVYTGAAELCDGQDNDCDGALDTDEVDDDSDGYVECAVDAGGWDGATTPDFEDCDDTDNTVYPGAAETTGDEVDSDCDGGEICYEDLDTDTFGTDTTVVSSDTDCGDSGESTLNTDCDDTDITAYPGATEVVADGVDQDCDTFDDCYQDSDTDTYGSTTVITSADLDCDDSGESSTSDDCDDADNAAYPGATETVADGTDQDCDGGDLCYEDLDLDTYGTSATVESTDLDCIDSGESATDDDCDDGEISVNPGATEIAGDEIDGDCDDTELCFVDGDLDGYGTTTTVSSSDIDCSASGESTFDTDCDDGAIAVYPGADETVSDGVDQDCDGFDACYDDSDGDGYGSTATVATSDTDCLDAGESYTADDCDDTESETYPSAAPNDSATDCMKDVDLDDWGDAWPTNADVVAGTDCDDSDINAYPGATEQCGDVGDDDCDDIVDEGSTTGGACYTGGELVISELLPDANRVITLEHQFFEIYNPSLTASVDLQGMRISTDDGTTSSAFFVSESLVVSSQGYVVFCYSDADLGSLCDYVYGSDQSRVLDPGGTEGDGYDSSFELSASGAQVAVSIGGYGDSDQSEVSVDSVDYYTDTSNSWPTHGVGHSYELSRSTLTATDNDDGANWCQADSRDTLYSEGAQDYGTPGSVNTCN